MKKYLILFLVLVSLKAAAQREMNLISDYLNADYVALVKVGKTNVLDTNGMYTNQEVYYNPIKVFKGSNNNEKSFYAWLENHNVVWQAGSIRGFFLKKSAPDEQSAEVKWYWIENSGFNEADTSFINTLANTQNIKKQIAKYWDDEMPGAWAKAKIIMLPKSNDLDIYEPGIKCTIALEQDNDFLEAQKGKTSQLTIYPDYFSSPAECLERLKQGNSYDFFIFQTDGVWETKAEFIFR